MLSSSNEFDVASQTISHVVTHVKEKTKPKRSLILILVVITSLVIGVFGAFLKNFWIRVDKLSSKSKTILFILPFFLGTSAANDLKVGEGFYRASYDYLTLPNDEKIGLLGTNYLLNFDDSYLGLGLYSAVDGQRGGFFTGGVELGHQFGLGDGFSLDGGLFVGGGGGSSVPQGGGLMLRPHLGLIKNFGHVDLGFGVSKVKFPSGNGEIDSDQLNLQMDIPFGFVYKSSDSDKSDSSNVLTLNSTNNSDIGWKDHYIAPTLQHYMVDHGVKNTAGQLMPNDMDLVGFEYGTKLGRDYYSYLEIAGAGSSGTDGFAEVLGGVGYSSALSRNFGFNIKGALGAAGGGGVDTGGGLIHKQSIGLYARPFDKLSFLAEVGRVGAFEGSFKATSSKLSLQYPFKLLSTGGYTRKVSNYDYISDSLWGVSLVNQTYLNSDTLRKHGSNDSVQLFGIKLDRYLDDDTYLTGQALAAYKGEVGGYAVGLVGVGQKLEITDKLSLLAEIGVGVADGGVINPGGGIIVQPMIGLNYKLNSDTSLQASIGKVKTVKNGGDANVVELGFSYKFKTIE